MPGPRQQPFPRRPAIQAARAAIAGLSTLALQARGHLARDMIRLGGHTPGLNLDLSRMARIEATFKIDADGLDFDLPAGQALHLGAAGAGGFARRFPARPRMPLIPVGATGEGQIQTPDLARLSVRAAAAPCGDISLALAWIDAQGAVVGRSVLPITRRRRDWFLRPPQGAVGAEPRLALTGAGRAPHLNVTLEPVSASAFRALGLTPKTQATPPANLTGAVNQAVRALFARRDHQALIDLHAEPGMRSDLISKLAFFSLVELRLFEQALAFHADWAPDDETIAEWERRRLESLGNLDRWPQARRIVEAHLDRDDKGGRLALLIQGFAYTAADARLRRRLVETIVAADHIPVGRDPTLTDIANRCLFMPNLAAAEALFERVRGHGDLAANDRRMLGAQKALTQGDFIGQLAGLNAVLGGAGLEPIASTNVPAPLTLSAVRGRAGLVGVIDGPPVSVIMTAFNSADTVGYALEALLSQTYANLEVILVDDASADDTARVALAVAAGRPLTLLRRERNAGSYAGRNLGLAQAKGRYVVMQDSDDWAHPRKIERLVAATSQPGAVAAVGKGLRLTPGAGFLSRGGFVQADGSSLLFEREAVLARMGGFEPVRVGADGEFHRRMERCFGQEAVREIQTPLSIISVRPGSLSRGHAWAIEPETGVFTPDRNQYRQAYLRRHEQPGADWMRPLAEDEAAPVAA